VRARKRRIVSGSVTARISTVHTTVAVTGCASGHGASAGTAVGLPNSVRPHRHFEPSPERWVLYACFAAAGEKPPLAPLVLAYQISYLSNVIPVPGGLGVLDGSMIGMLVLYGVGGTVATAATLVYHAIALWVPALCGAIAFVLLQRTKRQPVVLRNPPEELPPRVR